MPSTSVFFPASTGAAIRTPVHGRRLRALQAWLAPADVRLDGARPWDIALNHPDAIGRLASGDTLAIGDAYVDGLWDCRALDELTTRLWTSGILGRLGSWRSHLHQLRALLGNPQQGSRALAVAERHYDRGNTLYAAMLDARMIYSCGYWREARTLDEAQEAKLDLIARKLALRPGMRVLDVGCGWGGALAYLAEHYGVTGVGLTVSREQARWARRCYGDLPLEFVLSDYRTARPGLFDRVFSVGMFEHVGNRNHAEYFGRLRDFVAPDGWVLLHTIGSLRASHAADPWISRHIFPNSVLPTAPAITGAVAGRFVIEDWHNFGADYDPTLMAWHRNFSEAWPILRPAYGERFRRLWQFYLLTCAGFFRARQGQLWQLVLSPRGIPGGYRAEGIR